MARDNHSILKDVLSEQLFLYTDIRFKCVCQTCFVLDKNNLWYIAAGQHNYYNK